MPAQDSFVLANLVDCQARLKHWIRPAGICSLDPLRDQVWFGQVVVSLHLSSRQLYEVRLLSLNRNGTEKNFFEARSGNE
jgi:hypothetical protein